MSSSVASQNISTPWAVLGWMAYDFGLTAAPRTGDSGRPFSGQHREAGMKYARSIFLCLFVIGGVLQVPVSASAANGDQVDSVTFDTECPSGIGVGITFDGTNLWYSCDGTPTPIEGPPAADLYRANPSSGVVTASYNVADLEGLGALAYDATRNAIWAGWGTNAGAGKIRLIQLNGTKDVTDTTDAFTAGEAYDGLLDDGLAFDAQDDSLYVSPDASTTIYHYAVGGSLIGSFLWGGTGCFNSGLAVGGNLLFEGSNGCSHVWVVNKSTHAASFDFPTTGTRDEGLTCDSETFAEDVVWSMEAYDSNFEEGATRTAFAFEVPAGTCGIGGEPPASHTLMVSKAGTGTGTVTSSPAGIDCGATCSASFSEDTSVTLTATADAGSTFSSWSGDCSGTACTVTMDADKSVTAIFNQTSTGDTASGFVLPGGTIQTCQNTSSTDNTCSAITLPNTGFGATITITEQAGSLSKICNGPCSNQTTTYAITCTPPTPCYTDIKNPPKVILRYRTPGTSTKADMYFLHSSSTKSFKIPDCLKNGIAKPNPCVSARNRLGFGTNDLQVQVLVTSDDPIIGKR
jgi:hypothetical protein